MHLRDLFERDILPKGWNPKSIDPALLTLDEYYKVANPSCKHHPSDAYDVSMARLNHRAFDPSEYPTFIRRLKLNGTYFEVRLKTEPRGYMKTDADGEYLRDAGGNLIPFTKEEIDRLGKQPHEYSFAVFNEDGERVASAQDEWGCMLIMVAREYRGFGIGPILGKIARAFEPGKDSGGFTPGGLSNFVRVHREFVRDALTTGRYLTMIKAGEISLERVKEIVSSAKLGIRPRKSNKDYGSNNPKDWLLYAKDGCFVIYDRKIKDIYDGSETDRAWAERMIKGYLLVRMLDTGKRSKDNQPYAIVVRFGAESPKIKGFLLTLGAAWCKDEGFDFRVDEDDLRYVEQARCEVGNIDKRTGFARAGVTITTNEFDNVDRLGIPERRFRATFDQYDEFVWELLAMADAKYRPS